MNPRRLLPLLLLAALAPVRPVHADASVQARLEARGIKYTVDADGDYKVTYNFSGEGRTQLVFVSGSTQSVGGFLVREVFAPAARADHDPIDGQRALDLLRDSRLKKLGGWELHGDVLYFVLKLPDTMGGAELESAMDIAASVADEMEKEISGDRDAL